MAVDLSLRLAETIAREVQILRAVSEEQSSLARAPGKWSAKEELGHLVDSAANNHLRFAGAALQPQFQGPGYAQDEWVTLHGYSTTPWRVIIEFWFAYNSFLTRLLERIPEARLETQCFIGTNEPVTLRFLIDDYIVHMQHHIDQLLRRDVVTQYPRASIGTAR